MGDFFKAKLHFNEMVPDLIEEREVRSNSNIYMICKRPKVRFVPGSITELNINGLQQLQTGLLDIQSGSGRKQVPFAFDAQEVLKAELLRFDPSQYPKKGHSTIDFKIGDAPHSTLHALIDVYDDETNEIVHRLDMELELDYLSSHFKWYVPALQDLEILYIGQSFGVKYESTSEQRLDRHQARQAITSEASQREDFDVIGVYMDFKVQLCRRDVPGIGLQVPMPAKNVLDLLEGSLINQFQPRFNKQCKDKYPRGPAMVEDIQRLNVDDIYVNIDSSHDPVRFFSSTSEVSFVQNVAYKYLPDGTSINETKKALPVNPDYPTGNRQIDFWSDNSGLITEIGKQLQKRLRPNFLSLVGDRLRGLKQTAEKVLDDIPGRKM